MFKLRNPRINYVLTVAGVALVRLLFRTLRVNMRLASPDTSPYQRAEARHFVYSVWHDSMLIPIFLGRQPSTMALVGRHRDGSLVSNVLKCVGIPSVRGSSSRGGAEAVRQLIDSSRGFHIVMTPDGPRGPRREIKQGLAFVASRTGKLVVPTAFACRRYWSFNGNWTNLVVPRPFTRVFVLTGEPISIPDGASREEMDMFTAQIQQEMDRLDCEAHTLAGHQVDTLRSGAEGDDAASSDLPAARAA